jgi:hypothetical protein
MFWNDCIEGSWTVWERRMKRKGWYCDLGRIDRARQAASVDASSVWRRARLMSDRTREAGMLVALAQDRMGNEDARFAGPAM